MIMILGMGLVGRPAATMLHGTGAARTAHKTERPAELARYAQDLRGYAMLSTILLILLIVLLVGALSGRRRWGHGPGGVVGLVLIIVLVLLLVQHHR
jgi:Protein of unknown function (DUF3309)